MPRRRAGAGTASAGRPRTRVAFGIVEHVEQHVVEVDDPPLALESSRSSANVGASRFDAAGRTSAVSSGEGRVPLGRDAARHRPRDLVVADLDELVAAAEAVARAEHLAAVAVDPTTSVFGRRSVSVHRWREHGEHHGVERSRLDVVTESESVEASAQLARCLAGEGQRERVASIGVTGRDPVSDAPGEHSGLARPGTGDDSDEVRFGRDGSTLVGSRSAISASASTQSS